MIHNHEVESSSLSPATKKMRTAYRFAFFVIRPLLSTLQSAPSDESPAASANDLRTRGQRRTRTAGTSTAPWVPYVPQKKNRLAENKPPNLWQAAAK